MNPRSPVKSDPRRELPSVDRLIRQVLESNEDLPDWATAEGARIAVARAREALEAGQASPPVGDAIVETAAREARRLMSPAPRRVINATGVVLHTNLGRAPLAPGAAAAAADVAAGYSDLELDLETGRRGNRLGSLGDKLRLLSGAEAATVCNNNAAAVLLILNTLAEGKEVVVSRGELVEIGGSFRVPEIMERAGCRLIEVGTTNRTHARDYANAIGPETALLLKVHRSNFEQRGFVKEVDLPEISEIARANGLPVVEDLGSGTLLDLSEAGWPPEAFAPSRLRAGADVICFSGDKLMGGPQAGIILGGSEIVERVRGNPMARALRLDKMTIAALDWTLSRMLDGSARAALPAVRQLLEPAEAIEVRARTLARALQERAPGLVVSLEADRVPVGGGSLPGFELDTWVVSISGNESAKRIATWLREAATPILTRVRDERVIVDLRTLAESDLAAVVERLGAAFD